MPAEKILVTLGDAAGIGPEVTLKALAAFPPSKRPRALLVGSAGFYSALAHCLKLRMAFKDIAPADWSGREPFIPCYYPGTLPRRLIRGRSSAPWTAAAVLSIETAVRLAMQGAGRAIVTPPVNKAGLKSAGFDIPGHTEFMARLAGARRFEMMLVGGRLRVLVVTRHVPIRDVPGLLTQKKIEDAILMADRELRLSFGIRRPRIVVCGLNPHAGEQGVIGDEEIRLIAPAVKAASGRARSVIVGPLSPDALFYDAYAGRYDAEICMYHDQGLIPLKMISRGRGVNVTLGLPFVRTSPDHGTAYDIAGRFKADAGSMKAALALAISLAQNRRHKRARLLRRS